MTTNAAALTTDPPASAKKWTVAKVVSGLIAVLGGAAAIATAYNNAVDALTEARKAAQTAERAEPVTKESYEELSKTVTDLTQQLNETKTELSLLVELVEAKSTAGSGVPSPVGHSPVGGGAGPAPVASPVAPSTL